MTQRKISDATESIVANEKERRVMGKLRHCMFEYFPNAQWG
jgi:hypothetical protein